MGGLFGIPHLLVDKVDAEKVAAGLFAGSLMSSCRCFRFNQLFRVQSVDPGMHPPLYLSHRELFIAAVPLCIA